MLWVHCYLLCPDIWYVSTLSSGVIAYDTSLESEMVERLGNTSMHLTVLSVQQSREKMVHGLVVHSQGVAGALPPRGGEMH